MIKLAENITIPPSQLVYRAIRAQGSGGQNVNKVATAIALYFDVQASSLPEHIKQKLLTISDRRVTADGVIVIKAQQHRSQHMNRNDAYARLQQMIQLAMREKKHRTATKPTRSARKKRLDGKKIRGKIKSLRGRVTSS